MEPEQRTASSTTYAAVLQEVLAEMVDRYARAEAILRDHACPDGTLVLPAEGETDPA